MIDFALGLAALVAPFVLFISVGAIIEWLAHIAYAYDMPEMHRTMLNLPLSSWQRLTTRAEKDEITASEANRRAIWLYTESRDRQEQGGEVIWRKPDAEREEIVWLHFGSAELKEEAAAGPSG